MHILMSCANIVLNNALAGYGDTPVAAMGVALKVNMFVVFFNYIIHENDSLKDNYFAGIVCRYWGYIGKIYTKLQRNVPIEQCYDIVIDAIRYVLDKRV